MCSWVGGNCLLVFHWNNFLSLIPSLSLLKCHSNSRVPPPLYGLTNCQNTRHQRLTDYCVGTGLIIKISFFAPFRIFSCKEITRCIGLQYPETATECTFDIRCWFPINSVIKVIYFQLIGFQHLSFAFPSLTQKVFLFFFSFFFFHSERSIQITPELVYKRRVRVQYFDPTDNLPKITIYTRH